MKRDDLLRPLKRNSGTKCHRADCRVGLDIPLEFLVMIIRSLRTDSAGPV